MKKYIALLRGINVSGKNKILMKDLQLLFEKLNFENIKTYIQSGNVVFENPTETCNVLAQKIETALKITFDIDVPVLILEKIQLEKILSEAPKEKNGEEIYFTILEKKASKEAIIDCQNKAPKTADYFEVKENVVYVFCKNGYGKTKLTNTFFEKKLNVKATTRNRNTLETLLEML
ncbi:MAG: DUF1697 domain-containing protein [Chitinophagaceae bacterium]|nr:DUF1697 domain-containing protein [Chitinophagaceae bacterium]